MNMYNVVIIGAGQLGSRHLQALKTASSPMNLIVIDNNVDSLKVAKQRYESLPEKNNKSIQYSTSLESLPSSLDLVVVATSSIPRASIVKSVLKHSMVKYLLLEKILFPRISDYEEISSLLKQNNINSWVNCPRRMFGMYQEIKYNLYESETTHMLFQGKDWGLCCNAIHFIDIFMYFSGEYSYQIDTTGLHDSIISSKRLGYIEFNGVIKIKTPNGNTLELRSDCNITESKLSLKNGDNIFIIAEDRGYWTKNGIRHDYKIPYQSQLTGVFADMLFTTGFCPLTPFELSVKYHIPFINAILEHYNKIQGVCSDMCPIT